MESVPEESLIPGMDASIFKKLKGFINKGQYDEVISLAEGMDKEEFLKYLCQVVTTLDQFEGLYGYLKQRKMVPSFLAYGEMVVVRKVIAESGLLETDCFGRCDSIYDAIALSLKEDRHDRVAGLFEAAQERPDWKHEFVVFVDGFFVRLPSREEQHATQTIFYSLRGRVRQEASHHFRNYLRKISGDVELAD